MFPVRNALDKTKMKVILQLESISKTLKVFPVSTFYDCFAVRSENTVFMNFVFVYDNLSLNDSPPSKAKVLSALRYIKYARKYKCTFSVSHFFDNNIVFPPIHILCA